MNGKGNAQSETSMHPRVNNIMHRKSYLTWTISRFGVVSGETMAVSLDGLRQRAMDRWPAARVCLSVERPTPVLAPRNAMVLEFVVILLVV